MHLVFAQPARCTSLRSICRCLRNNVNKMMRRSGPKKYVILTLRRRETTHRTAVLGAIQRPHRIECATQRTGNPASSGDLVVHQQFWRFTREILPEVAGDPGVKKIHLMLSKKTISCCRKRRLPT